jgi:hypothetical protein
MNIFTLARRMGTSLQMIDRTYGHLAQDTVDTRSRPQARGRLPDSDARPDS